MISQIVRNDLEKLQKYVKIMGYVFRNLFLNSISAWQILWQLKAELSRLVDRNADTIRFYRLGKNYKNQIEVIGKREDIELSQDNSIIL